MPSDSWGSQSHDLESDGDDSTALPWIQEIEGRLDRIERGMEGLQEGLGHAGGAVTRLQTLLELQINQQAEDGNVDKHNLRGISTI